MKPLEKRQCEPCRGDTPPLPPEEVAHLLNLLESGWEIHKGRQLEKEYKFPNFVKGAAFVQKLTIIAESEGHHPDILLSWGSVKVMLTTHKIQGLTESDFILAAKCDGAYKDDK